MINTGNIYCFQADYKASTNFDEHSIPDWLSLEINWQGYCISTVPWVADVARVLGILQNNSCKKPAPTETRPYDSSIIASRSRSNKVRN
ncbi:hypothetical protein [Aphanothece sacrum]